VVVVLRAASADHIDATAETLSAKGLSCLELTFTLPDVPVLIRRLRENLGGNACIGAGTVNTAAQARSAIEAGAQFLVSPMASAEVQREAAAACVPYVPGALTPTEISSAWDAGAAAVKVFPAAVMGFGYLSMLREPLPAPLLLPSGGVGIDDIAGYLAAGACAVSLGGALVGDALNGGPQRELGQRIARVHEELAHSGGRRG
jgi:2-dehydro-3-deoxyphosphogluconate aldolase/(4S)-4-hydroxy-2-oxoglutarate aldolase